MKQRIIDAAMRMFVEEGYEKTSIRNIAERIEYSPGTIYLYYADKDELLHEVQREAFEKLHQYFQEKATSRSPFKRLEQIAHAYIEFGLQQPELYDLMFIIRAPMNKAEEEPGWSNSVGCFSFLMECLQQCMEKKLIIFTDMKMASMSTWSMVHGLVSLHVRCRMKIYEQSEEEVIKAIYQSVNIYLQSIKA